MHKRTTPKSLSAQKSYIAICLRPKLSCGSTYALIRWGEVHFRNQQAIGNYISDFCGPEAKLVIELDGSQHLEQKEPDDESTKYFEARGYRVLRFWNNDVMNDMENVLKAIGDLLKESN